MTEEEAQKNFTEIHDMLFDHRFAIQIIVKQGSIIMERIENILAILRDKEV